jgi:L-malate glycosyltransferase
MSDRSLPSVVHVLWSGGMGGIERLVHDLSREQARAGMRVAVAFCRPTEPFAAATRDAGVRVLDLEVESGFELAPARLAAAGRKLRDFDVVHLHGFNPPLAAIVLRAGRPVVFTEHGNFGLWRQPRAVDPIKRRLQGLFLRRFARSLAANSRYTRERFCELYGVPQERVAVVHNGTDFASIAPPEARDAGANGLVAAYVGRLVRSKRVEHLVEASARVPADRDLRVLIVGGGPLEDELRRLVGELGLERRVKFLGYRTDLDAVLRDADLLVHPSAREPFGLAIVEACARGLLPVVFSDGGGALEVVPPDARIVSGVEELAGELERLRASHALSDSARRTRASWAREAFPIERTARCYLGLYRRALLPAAGGPG